MQWELWQDGGGGCIMQCRILRLRAVTLKCVRILRPTAVTLKCVSCNGQTVRDFWLGAYCAEITNYLAILEHYCRGALHALVHFDSNVSKQYGAYCPQPQ